MFSGKFKRKKQAGTGWIYLILAVIFVLSMIRWGLPLFINFLAGPTEEGGGKQTEDVVPPQTPTFAALLEATNSAKVKIEGYTEPEVNVSINRNDELVATSKSEVDGKFFFEITLIDGQNRLYVKARDMANNESQSVAETITLDTRPIGLTIDSPMDGVEFFGKDKQTITVLGKVTKVDASVRVNGNFALVDAEGKYTVLIRLTGGENQVVVRAIDKAGNSVEKTIKVKLTL